MESGRARYRDDSHRLPTLSLGLSSVRFIVNQIEAECARVVATDGFESSCDLVKYDPNVDEGYGDYDDFPLESSRGRVWARIAVNLGIALSRCIPSVTFGNFGILAVTIGIFAPKMISYLVVYPFCRLVFGTLYPAYASYKAVRTKNLKEYVKWMMYWIVFALFTCTETFTDVFLSWFPFYYEVKIVLVLWLLSPATKGSSILYRKFVHPALCRREQEIDEYIAKAKDQGYHTVLNLGTKGVNYATTVIMQTAIKNFNLPSPEQDNEGRNRKTIRSRDVTDGYQDAYEDLEYQRSDEANLPGIVEIVELDSDDPNPDILVGDGDTNDPDYEPDSSAARSRGNAVRKRKVVKEKRPRSKSRGRRTRSQAAAENDLKGGGGLVQQLRKSYSLSDLSECETREERGGDEADDVLAEPRLIRRGTKSGYSTRRSASESNSRSPMYFPEVDVDVRTARARTDEPDFSHIKSSEDISSGYSSADNSASLSRTASLGAAARRARPARAAVTPIKRPQAAEGSEVIIEELYDDDTFEYSNMPPLVNLPSPIFLSQTDPPFIYQYVGDQVRIIQVLGKDSLNSNSSKENNNTDNWDQKQIVSQKDLDKDEIENESKEIYFETETNTTHSEQINSIQKEILTEGTIQFKVEDNNDQISNPAAQSSIDTENLQMTVLDTVDKVNIQDIEIEQKTVHKIDEHLDVTTVDTSNYENDSAESDDEASFGTPEDSPKSKRKSPKGKYGKAKAPLPPKLEIPKNVDEKDSSNLDSAVSTTSLESLNDIINMLPNESIKETGLFKGGLQIVNPIAEKKRRHKSKSPGRIPKSQGSGISKLLQLPTKLAFWHKTDDKSKSDVSTSSDDHSRRSSTIDKQAEDYQSCLNLVENTADENLTPKADISDDQISFKDACDMDGEVISHDIIEKSDALQRLIEAKIESHPEYKFVSLHEGIQTESKSTDV